jgi:response regulator RpfG family c-di-GMP phosphodiesterase
VPGQTVLVIADGADVLRSIHDVLSRPGKQAAARAFGLEITSARPVDFIIVNQRSFEVIGIEFLIRVWATPEKMVQLLLVARADAVRHAVKGGTVCRSPDSPRDPMLGSQAIMHKTVQAFDMTREAWERTQNPHEPTTDGHSRRVSEAGVRLAKAMGMEEAQLVHLRRGGLLHDIGKIGIPDDILGKPGPLTPEERDIVKRHASYGYGLLAPLSFLKEALVIPYCHHERWDGTGYPFGFKGEGIPLAARIFAVIDVWDALCSDRPYRKAWPKRKARAYIRSLAGVHFDPKVVDHFLRAIN